MIRAWLSIGVRVAIACLAGGLVGLSTGHGEILVTFLIFAAGALFGSFLAIGVQS